MRYPNGRAEESSQSPVHGLRGLARLWLSETATVAPRTARKLRNLDLLPSSGWMRDAKAFLDSCAAERVDPARVVLALFDHARVQRRRGRTWRPSIRSARSEFSRKLYTDWEMRQRAKADGKDDIAEADVRRVAASQRATVESEPVVPRRPVVLRRVALPRALDARLLETLRRDAETYADYRRQYPRAYAWAPLALAPHSFSPAFRALVDDPDDSIADDPLVRRVLQDPERWREYLAALGVDAELLAELV